MARSYGRSLVAAKERTAARSIIDRVFGAIDSQLCREHGNSDQTSTAKSGFRSNLARASCSGLLCLVCDNFTGCDLRRVREQGGYILPDPVRSSSIGFLRTGL